jgi:hypothetical protein
MKQVTQNDLRALRHANLITENETAYIVDDIVIAESMLDNSKRKIDVSNVILESKRSLLKG